MKKIWLLLLVLFIASCSNSKKERYEFFEALLKIGLLRNARIVMDSRDNHNEPFLVIDENEGFKFTWHTDDYSIELNNKEEVSKFLEVIKEE